MSLEGADILWGNSFSGKYPDFYNWINNPYSFRDNTNIRPGYADTNPNDWRIDSTSPEGLKNLPNIRSTFLERAAAVIPQGYNSADLGGIFDSMTKVKGSTFGDAFAASASYNLMGLNEGMANYAKNVANDPLNKDNLKPFITTGDSGFANPLAAEFGAIVNYGKVQTEKDEVIVMPDGSIIDSASKSTHKKMKDEDVTEYLPQDSLVFSNKTMVKKDKFKKDKDDIVSATISNYTETDKPELPVQFRISDLFGSKKEMSSAELIKKVRSMFPVKESSGDDTEPSKLSPIDIRTNEANKIARMPYIAAIFDQVKGKMANVVSEKDEEKPTKAITGAVIPLIGMGLSAIGSVASQAIADGQYKRNMKLLEQGLKNNQRMLNLGTGFSMASTLAQDPYIPAREYGVQRALINQMPDSVQPYLYESLANQQSADNSLRTRSLFENTSSFNRAANAAAAYDANYLKARNDLMANVAYKNLELDANRRAAKLNFEDQVSREKQQRALGMTQNVNAILSNLGNIGTNWANQWSNLQYGYDAAKVGVNNAYAQTTAGNIQSGIQNATNMLGFMKGTAPTIPSHTPQSSNLMSGMIDNTEDYSPAVSYKNAANLPSRTAVENEFSSRLYRNVVGNNGGRGDIYTTPQLSTVDLPEYSYDIGTPKIDNEYYNFSNRLSKLEQKLGGEIPYKLLDDMIQNENIKEGGSLDMLRNYLYNPLALNKFTSSDLEKAIKQIKKEYNISK